MPARTKHLLIVIAIFMAEILVAAVFSNIITVRSYLSDFLAVILLYHFVVCDDPISAFAALVFIFACGVEIAQYFHLADSFGLPRGSLFSAS